MDYMFTFTNTANIPDKNTYTINMIGSTYI